MDRTLVTARLIGDRAYDTVTDKVWDSINKGVGFPGRKVLVEHRLILETSDNGRTSERNT